MIIGRRDKSTIGRRAVMLDSVVTIRVAKSEEGAVEGSIIEEKRSGSFERSAIWVCRWLEKARVKMRKPLLGSFR